MKNNLSYGSRVTVGENSWLSCDSFNALMLVSKDECTAEYVKSLPGCNSSLTIRAYKKIYKLNKLLYLIPEHAKGICVLNTEDLSCVFVPIASDKVKNNRWVDSIKIDNYIWLFGAFYDNLLICFDTNTNTFSQYDFVSKCIPEHLQNEGEKIIWDNVYNKDGIVYAAIHKKNLFLHINLIKRESKCISLGTLSVELCGIAVDRTRAYCIAYNTFSVYAYDFATKDVTEFLIDDSIKSETRDVPYSNIFEYQGNIYLIPNKAKAAIWWLEDEKIRYRASMPEGFLDNDDYRANWIRFNKEEIRGDYVKLYPEKANMEITYWPRTNRVEGKVITVKAEWFDNGYQENIVNPFMNERQVTKEGGRIGLKELIKYLID